MRPVPGTLGKRIVGTVYGPPKQLMDIERIYLEPAVESYVCGQEILAKYPHASASMLTRTGRLRPCMATKGPRISHGLTRYPTGSESDGETLSAEISRA
jgi:hypothetical protein